MDAESPLAMVRGGLHLTGRKEQRLKQSHKDELLLQVGKEKKKNDIHQPFSKFLKVIPLAFYTLKKESQGLLRWFKTSLRLNAV